MGYYTFRWPHPADEVYVTGTFDNWAKTVNLDQKGDDGFAKEVKLPSDEKTQYKFVVDGVWKTDTSAPQEDDGSNNINNYLLSDQLSPAPQHTNRPTGVIASTMSGVTPESTTAGLAGNVPKESKSETNGGPGAAAISSAAPDSTTAQLAKDVPLEGKQDTIPGTFPETPGTGSEDVSVNPLPATSGAGNPINLQPGEKVPDSSTITNNTVNSTVRTDKAGYEADASAPGMSALGGHAGAGAGGGDVSILPFPATNNNPSANKGPAIQSAAPGSTTAGLAAGVPLEGTKSAEPTADDVPLVVRDSIEKAHTPPEAASSGHVVEEKKEVERELLDEVPQKNTAGEPAPVDSAEATQTAPGLTQPAAGVQSGDISPKTKEPAPATQPAKSQEQPTVTTGAATDTIPKESGSQKPQQQQKEQQSQSQGQGQGQQQETSTEGEGSKGKKKNRVSGLFSKLKEKLK